MHVLNLNYSPDATSSLVTVLVSEPFKTNEHRHSISNVNDIRGTMLEITWRPFASNI
jgi:hypothetical protein